MKKRDNQEALEINSNGWLSLFSSLLKQKVLGHLSKEKGSLFERIKETSGW